MTTNPTNKLLEMKIKLSALWIVVLFNMIFRDLHEFLRTGFLEETLAMTSNGAQVSEGLLLAAAIVLEIPIAMIFLTQVLNAKANRWANLVAAVFMLVAIISNNLAPDLDDVFYVAFECVALLLVIWYAWRWSND
jgi:uncharacterized membrane protein YphA (DoxX/SURF4 family)